MDSKRPRSSETNPSAKGDNFKLIKGVSATVESRLHQAGILTYAQFASLSTEDIITLVANLSGLTVERIIRQNWTGQARELALRPKSDEPVEEKTPPVNGERYATFVAELSLDANNNIINTRIRHVQSGDEMTWGKWREDQFVKFFTEHANPYKAETSVKQEAEKPEAAPAASPSETPPFNQTAVEVTAGAIPAEPIRDAEKTETAAKPSSAKPSPASPTMTEIATKVSTEAAAEIATEISTEAAIKPRARKLEILAAGSDLPSTLLRHDQAFDVRVSLDLPGAADSRKETMAYTAIVYARSLSDKRAQSFSRASGKITLSERTVIKLGGISLKPGAYRLAADVTIHQPGQSAPLTPDFHIQTEAALIRVY